LHSEEQDYFQMFGGSAASSCIFQTAKAEKSTKNPGIQVPKQVQKAKTLFDFFSKK